jgi:hypothetical protein
MKSGYNKQVAGFAVLGLLVLLPGCFGDKSASKGSIAQEAQTGSVDEKDVLVSIDGKPLITVATLAKEKADLMEANPQLKAMIAFMDEKQLDRNIAEGLAAQAIIEKYIADKKIDETPEYKKEMENLIRSVRHMINGKFFGQNVVAEVTDAEVQDFYDKNKASIPQLMISAGGVKAMGVQFDTQAKAQEFAGKVNGNIQKAAEAAGLKAKLQNFNVVNAQSIGMHETLRDKIAAITKTPAVEVIKVDDKTFWVVSATEKEDAKYQPFEQVKAGLKGHLEKEKRDEALKAELERLRGEYKVVMNESYFASAAPQDQEVPAFE